MKLAGQIVTVAIAAVFSSTALAGTFGFSDQTTNAGLGVPIFGPGGDYRRGGAVGDFNADGFQDIFITDNSETGVQLYINNGNGTFTEMAEAWGIFILSASSASVADYNHDGRLDLYVSSADDGQQVADILFRNNGDSTFTNVSIDAGIRSVANPETSAHSWGTAWGDYDLDGDLDLAMSNRFEFSSQTNGLFRNNGNGTFSNVSNPAHLTDLNTPTPSLAFSPRFIDLNDDLYPELVVTGDYGNSRYYANNKNGTFTNYTLSSGINQGSSEMGFTVGDYNLDGRFDLYMTLIGYGNMYLNQSNHTFVRPPQETSGHPQVWGWGAVSIDFDHDNRVDIITTSQDTSLPGLEWGQTALRNQSSGGIPSFADVTTQAHIDADENGRGLANFDYDNDGDQDIIIFNSVGPPSLYRNDLSGDSINWLRVFLDTTGTSDIAPNGIGSVVRIHVGADWRMGRIDGGSNYLSQSELSAHFGLGAETIVDEIRVEWTDGSVTSLFDVTANQTLTISACPDHCPPPMPGDTDCNQQIDGRDIEGLSLAILDVAAYESRFFWCDRANADVNGDAGIDVADIAALVAILVGDDSPVPGDLNCDDRIDGADIEPFLLALLNPSIYQSEFAGCDIDRADMDHDGQIDQLDIPPFVDRLVQD